MRARVSVDGVRKEAIASPITSWRPTASYNPEVLFHAGYDRLPDDQNLGTLQRYPTRLREVETPRKEKNHGPVYTGCE